MPALFATIVCTFLGFVAAPTGSAQDKITWFNGTLDEALTSAAAARKQVLLYFWANEDEQCKRLYGKTMQDADCIQSLANFVCHGADVKTPAGEALQKKFGVSHLPTILIVDKAGTAEDALVGFLPPKRFLEELARIKKGKGTSSDYKKRIAAKPKDLELRSEYATLLRRVGDKQGYDATVAVIRKSDPRGKTLPGAHVFLRDLQDKIDAQAEPNATPVARFLKRTSHKPVRWQGWRWVGWVEFDGQEYEKARSALELAWKYCPKLELLAFSQQLSARYWGIRERLRQADKKFIMKVGEAQAARAEKLRDPKAPGRDVWVEGDFKSFLATRLDILACCYHMARKRKLAMAAAQRCIKLEPENEIYKKRLKLIEDGK